MPEGDTIHRMARGLNAALAGKRITRFETVLPALARVDQDAPLAGRTIERAEASGKNLLLHLSGDLHLHTHMRMHGTWHLYRPGERWRKRRSDMRIVIETEDFVAVAFNVPVAEFHDARSLERQDDLRLIGPDLLGETFDEDEALRRVRARDDRAIAEVLLNQRVVAGIGNEYKSELLFLERIDPFAPASSVTDDQLRKLFRTARKIMRWNVDKPDMGRRTRNSLDRAQSLYVYGRGGKPCRRCGTPVSYAKQGLDARGTWWCAKCQGVVYQ